MADIKGLKVRDALWTCYSENLVFRVIIVELQWPKELPSGAPYTHRNLSTAFLITYSGHLTSNQKKA